MSSFGTYYNDYTNNPSPMAAERLQQKPPVEHSKPFPLSSNLQTSKWSRCLWISFIIFAFICLLVATIVPLVVALTSLSRITSTG